MKIKKINHKCCMCGKTAVWYKEIHGDNDALYYCDDCVPRTSIEGMYNIDDFGEPVEGASVMWWNEDSMVKDLVKDGSLERKEDSFYYVYLDEKGRRSASENYTYNANGFPKTKKEPILSQIDIMSAYGENLSLLTKMEAKRIGTGISEILMDEEAYELRQTIPYNLFMSQLGDRFKTMNLTYPYNSNLKKFYNKFKKELSECKN